MPEGECLGIKVVDFQKRVILTLFVVYIISTKILKDHFKMVKSLNIIIHLDITA